MADEKAYAYTPLAEPDNSIRLIKILSITPRICCQFSVVSLANSPGFTALSYTWGDPTATEPITVGNGTIRVTVNLANAIRDVYGHWRKGDLIVPEREQWLWADALCIDQQNVQEKNHQVPLMEKIYSSACHVFAWLGSDEDRVTCRAIDACSTVLSMISQLPGYEYIQARAESGTFFIIVDEDAISHIPADSILALTDLDWLKKYYQEMGPVDTCQALVKLSDAPYWSRLWILQELVLGKTVTILCGSRSIAWVAICSLYSWFKIFGFKHAASDRPKYVPIGEWSTLTSFAVRDCISDIGSCRTIKAAREALEAQTFSKRHSSRILRMRYATSLFAVRRQAINPKDYVYALRGITEIRLPIDYSASTTVAQVYQDYLAEWLRALREAQTEVASTDPNALCDLWFLGDAGLGLPWGSSPGLPSWTPNFMGVAEANHNGDYCTPVRNSPSDADVFLRSADSAILPDSSLCCTAVHLDDVNSTGPIIRTKEERNTSTPEADAWLLWIYDIAVELTTANRANGVRMLFTIVRLLCSDEAGARSDGDQDLTLHLLIAELENVCAKRRALSHVMVFFRLGMMPPSESVAAHEGEPFIRRFFAIFRHMGGKFPDQEQLERFFPIVRAYEQSLERLNGLAIAITKSGLVGLFPPLTQNGDLISMLQGFDGSVVLRKYGDDYHFVGACHVPGLQDGQANRMVRDGQVKRERIKIY